MNTVSREYWFSAAHMVEGHPKCGRMHGHNYKVTIHVSAQVLDSMGMVIDFGSIDVLAKPILDALDHRVMYSEGNVKAGNPYIQVSLQVGDGIVLPVQQTTAECLSQLIHKEMIHKLMCDPSHVAIQVEETHRSVATYTVTEE